MSGTIPTRSASQRRFAARPNCGQTVRLISNPSGRATSLRATCGWGTRISCKYRKQIVLTGAGTLTGRVDVTSDTQIDLGARYTLTTQRPGSPELPAGTARVTVTNQPIIFSSGATLGATQRFNRLELSLKGTFDRTVNQNATQSDGTIIDLAANNFNAYGA